MKKISIKIKLILLGILTVIIPVLILGFVSVKQTSEALISIANERALQIAIEIADLVDTTLKQEIKIAYSISHAHIILNTLEKIDTINAESSKKELDKTDNYLKKLFEKIGNDYETIILTDKIGNIISGNQKYYNKNISIKERDYFISIKNGNASSIGNPVWLKIHGNPVCVVGVPVKNTNDVFLGMLGLVIKLDTLYEKISNVKIGNTGYPFMVNREGLIITHPNKAHVLKTNLAQLEDVQNIIAQMVEQKRGVDSYVFEGLDKIAGFAPVFTAGWSVGVTQETAEFMKPVKIIRQVIAVSIVIFILVVIIGILYFTNIIILPINWILEGLGKGSEKVFKASLELLDSSRDLSKLSVERCNDAEEIAVLMEEIISIDTKKTENINKQNILIRDIGELHTDSVSNELLEKLTVLNKTILTLSKDQRKNMDTVYKIIKTLSNIIVKCSENAKQVEINSEKMNIQSEKMIMDVNELVGVISKNNGNIMR